MTRAALIAAIAALMLVLAAQARAATVLPAGFNEVQVATGFSTPVAVDWTPDGRAFVAEKSGRVRVVNPDGSLRTAPLIDIRDKVNAYSDRGMLGIAVDTDFATNGFVYLLYVVELSPTLPDTETPAV